MKRSTVGQYVAFRCSRFTRLAPCIGWLALGLPAGARSDVPGPNDRQVIEIVNRVKPSVVSIRVGGPRKSQSALPFWGEDDPNAPFIDGDTQTVLLPAIFTGDGDCGAAVAAAGVRQIRPAPFKLRSSFLFSSRVGTGFCIDPDGSILTTTSVVGDSHQVQVKLADGRELSGKVLGSDPASGVAVVKLDGAGLPALRLSAHDRPAPGQWAVIVGNQLDRDHSVWVGTLARTDVALGPAPVIVEPLPAASRKLIAPTIIRPVPAPAGKLLQIDAPAGAGASGAPVLNAKGDVIGVVVATSGPPAPALAAAFEQDRNEEKPRRDEEKARRDEGKPRRDEEKARPDELKARRDADRARRLKDRLGKEDPAWEAQVEKISAEAERIGERASAHAEALSARIEERAKQIAAEAEARSRSLHERAAEEARRDAEDKSKSDADRQRLQAERQRRLADEMKPLMEDLQRKLDRDLKPLEEELKRQLDQDLKPLQEQLKKLNEMLPMVQGLREISIDLAPEIARSITEAHKAAGAALAAAMKAGVPALPALPAAPPSPPSTPAPAAPEPSPAPESAPAPGAQPAALVTPAPSAAPLPLPAVVAAPEPPGVSFWAGSNPELGASTYAIPADTVGWVVSQIRERGRVSHPFLGVRLETLKSEERERLKAPDEARVRVGMVWPNSPASEAGLRIGDLILEFDGKKVDGATDLADRLARAKTGERVSMAIWRDGQRQTLHVTPREMTFAQPFFRAPVFTMPPGQPFFRGPITIKPDTAFAWRGKMDGLTGPMPRNMFVFRPGHVSATASGSGRDARVTLESQDAELESVLRELSRATRLQFTAEGEAARQHVTLKVEQVPVDDLVGSMERLFHLRADREGDRITFRPR